MSIQYITTEEEYAEPLRVLFQNYSQEITLQPLYDETWKKLEILTSSGKESAMQAIELADAINPEYLASIFNWISNNSIVVTEDFSDVLDKWRKDVKGWGALHLSYLINGIEGKQPTRKFFAHRHRDKHWVTWLQNGSVVSREFVYETARKQFGLKENITTIQFKDWGVGDKNGIGSEYGAFRVPTNVSGKFSINPSKAQAEGRQLDVTPIVTNIAAPQVQFRKWASNYFAVFLSYINMSKVSNALKKANLQKEKFVYVVPQFKSVYSFKNTDFNDKSIIKTMGTLFVESDQGSGKLIPLGEKVALEFQWFFMDDGGDGFVEQLTGGKGGSWYT